MHEGQSEPLSRRGVILGGGASLVLISLAACQSARVTGAEARKSAEAEPYVDRLRSENGVATMRPDRELETAALGQARLMAGRGRMVHKTGLGKGFAARMKGVADDVPASENIAHGRFDVAGVVSVWMHSPPHRRNLLDPAYARYGLAYVADAAEPERRYWAMVMAG